MRAWLVEYGPKASPSSISGLISQKSRNIAAKGVVMAKEMISDTASSLTNSQFDMAGIPYAPY